MGNIPMNATLTEHFMDTKRMILAHPELTKRYVDVDEVLNDVMFQQQQDYLTMCENNEYGGVRV